jgi:hypothetical protein
MDNHVKLYPLDRLMVQTFIPDKVFSTTIYDDNNVPHYKINHIDGNLRNNRIDNLSVESSVEKWLPISLETIVKYYEVSSWGRVRSTHRNKLMHVHYDKNGYPFVRLISVNNNRLRKFIKIHRLVAKAFVIGYKDGYVVNHINGVKTDNMPSNLEWISDIDNKHHAEFSGLCYNDNNMIRDKMVIDSLIRNDGNRNLVYEELVLLFPDITESIIANIRHKLQYHDNNVLQYNKNRLQFISYRGKRRNYFRTNP